MRTSGATLLLWRVRAIPEMRKACFRLEPIAAFIDAWILAGQMHRLFSESGGTGAFGPFQAEAVEVSRSGRGDGASPGMIVPTRFTLFASPPRALSTRSPSERWI
jgi:hypothetical protein